MTESLIQSSRPPWGAKEVEAQRAAGWFCYGCAKHLDKGEGIVLRVARVSHWNGREVTHGLYCSRKCHRESFAQIATRRGE